jgi:hypothetical protein
MKRPVAHAIRALAITIISASLPACGNDSGSDGAVESASAVAASAPTTNSMLEGLRSKSPAVGSLLASAGKYDEKTGWPQAVTVKLPQSEEETRFLSEHNCRDNGCFNDDAFDRAILKANPDIRKAPFRPGTDVASDKDTASMYRQSYHRSLYFAKHIKLADGSTLYDFLAKCSRTLNYLDAADLGLKDGKMDYYDLRYYAVLRQADTGSDVELDLLFDRAGDELRANSPFFSTSVLATPDYLKVHHVECRSASDPLVTKSID